MCLALVMGNMIGSGVYLLPGALAPFGWAGVLGWFVTIAGALVLAWIFGRLASRFPKAGGPYAYTREAFGPFAGFLIAWSYWASLWIGNVAIATGVVAPLSTIFPRIAEHSALVTFALVWSLTLLNCWGTRHAGRLQLATMVLKGLPLVAVIILAASVAGSGAALPPLDATSLSLGGESGIMAAAALTLWAFLGLESATVPAEKVSDPRRTIFRATLVGTALTGAIYLFACSAVALLLPPQQAAASGAPIADFVALHWGAGAGTAVALFAAISAFGALNGWILLQGEMPWAMARDGVMPAWLARTSRWGTPARAHLVSSTFLSIVLLLNHSRSMAELFKFLVLLATTASLVPYLVCSLAALRVRAALPAVAAAGAIYAGWTIWGAGAEAIGWGLALLLIGIPVYFVSRRNLTAVPAVNAASPGPENERDHG
jgi:APA family basic amino acid/polyamine antiporter